MDQLIHLPWYVKAFLALGGASLLWKVIQGAVPTLLKWLLPLALKLTDSLVALILAYPVLRWFVLGNKDNVLKTINALLDGLEDISNAVQERLAKDLNEAPDAIVKEKVEAPTIPPTAPPAA